MMILSTIPVSKNGKSVAVHWGTGMRNHGVVEVEVEQQEDREILAELAAIRYLVFDRQVFGRKPVRGNGYELRVYSGAIKKLVQRRSQKQHLVQHSLFLSRSLSGVTINVVKQKITDPFFGTAETWISDNIYLDGAMGMQGVQWDTAIGPLVITEHALKRFESRVNLHNTDQVSNPAARLLRALKVKSERFVKIELPERIKHNKLIKYGGDVSVEHWRDIQTGLSLTLTRCSKSSTGTLLTCFYRS